MKLEEAIKILQKTVKSNNEVIKEARKNEDVNVMQLTADLDNQSIATETVLKAFEDKDKEIIDMREMIVRVAKSLEKKGKYELSEYILAQIEATPTFTTWEDYTTWIPKKKIEDKIEELRGRWDFAGEEVIEILQELLEE